MLIVIRIINRLEYNQGATIIPVTDPKTWALFTACIQNYIPLKICNMVMGFENPVPAANVPNTCCIEYISNGIAKIREVAEDQIMDFSWDVIEVQYGDLNGKHLSSDYYQTFPALGKYIMDAQLSLGTFQVSAARFLKDPADDPTNGGAKSASIKTVHVRQPGRWRVPDANQPAQWKYLGYYYAWVIGYPNIAEGASVTCPGDAGLHNAGV
jgi:hypothetical protein